MFNKRASPGDIIDGSNPASALGRTAERNRDTASEISVAGLSSKDKAELSNSVIDEWLVMKGDLESVGDILVKGKVLGNVRCKTLIVDEQAVIEGKIMAEAVVIRGTTKGEIQAKRVHLQSTAKVLSEIIHESFAAEEGAFIDGALRRREEVPIESKSEAAKAEKKSDKHGSDAPPPVAVEEKRLEQANGAAH